MPPEIRERIARKLGGPWSQQPHVTNLRATSKEMDRIWSTQIPPRTAGENLAVACNRKRFPWRALYQVALRTADDRVCAAAVPFLIDLTGGVRVIPLEQHYLEPEDGFEGDIPEEDVYDRQSIAADDVTRLIVICIIHVTFEHILSKTNYGHGKGHVKQKVAGGNLSCMRVAPQISGWPRLSYLQPIGKWRLNSRLFENLPCFRDCGEVWISI